MMKFNGLALSFIALGVSCTGADSVQSTSAALTVAQCNYFAVSGTTRICHRTNSVRNPYTVLNVATTACVSAHTGHAGDYVAIGDPTCHGGGCLPAGAPCDATLGCCSGATCVSGVCRATCTPTTCEAQHATCGTISDGCGDTLNCGPTTYASCDCDAGAVYFETSGADTCGNLCDSGCTARGFGVHSSSVGLCGDCAVGSACQSNTCVDDNDGCMGSPCQNGGTCTDALINYTCTCAPGWTGTNCETEEGGGPAP